LAARGGLRLRRVLTAGRRLLGVLTTRRGMRCVLAARRGVRCVLAARPLLRRLLLGVWVTGLRGCLLLSLVGIAGLCRCLLLRGHVAGHRMALVWLSFVAHYAVVGDARRPLPAVPVAELVPARRVRVPAGLRLHRATLRLRAPSRLSVTKAAVRPRRPSSGRGYCPSGPGTSRVAVASGHPSSARSQSAQRSQGCRSRTARGRTGGAATEGLGTDAVTAPMVWRI